MEIEAGLFCQLTFVFGPLKLINLLPFDRTSVIFSDFL